MRRALIAAWLAVAVSLVGPATARAQETPADPPAETGLGIRLAEAPTNLRDDPRAQVYVVDHVHPGTTLSRRIEVRNGTSSPLSPSLYVAPARIAGGAFSIGARGGAGKLTGWGSVAPGRVDLPPGGRATAVLRIAVPTDAEPGEYYGAAVAEVVTPGSSGVRLASRVGVRIYLAVGNGAAPVSDFEVTALGAGRTQGGTPVVTATVRNTGERALDMGGDLTLSHGPGGASAGPFPVQVVTTLAVGATEPVTVRLQDGLPAGPWKAKLVLRSGRIEHAVGSTITFPAAGAPSRSSAVERLDAHKRSMGVLAALLLLVVLAALAGELVRRRRRAVRPAVV